MTSGTQIDDRALLRLHVLRGYPGNRPLNLSRTLPVAPNVAVLSGMLVTPKWSSVRSRYEWSIGFDVASGSGDVDASAPSFFWAHDDWSDPDVLAAGNLLGLSGLGNYEMATPYVNSDYTYSEGEELTYDGVTGKMKPAAVNDLVIARVSRDYAAPVDFGAVYTANGDVVNDDGKTVTDGALGASFTVATKSGAVSLKLLRFETVTPYILTSDYPVVAPQEADPE